MNKQTVEGVVSAEGDTGRRRIVPRSKLGAETAAVPSEPVTVLWKASGQGHLIGARPKTVNERLNEAYRDDELEPQEREFLNLTREHFSRFDYQ
jgi:hypothetical protein